MTEAGGARRYGLGALGHRNFRLFFIGQGISLVGTWMQNVGEGWLILTLTNSPFYVGLTAALSSLGVLLFSLYAGVIADRADKRRFIIFMQLAFMLEALTVAILVWTHVVAVWQVLLLATILGIASGFDIPMRQSFIVEMVGKDDLMNAIALNSSLFNGARVIGPAIAGFLIGAVGIAWCYFLNGVSYIAVIAGLLLMQLPPRAPPARAASAWTGFREVLAYLRDDRRLRARPPDAGGRHGLRNPAHPVFGVSRPGTLHGAARPHGVRDDRQQLPHEHADPNDRARSPTRPRHGVLLVRLRGHGAVRRVSLWARGRARWRAGHAGGWWRDRRAGRYDRGVDGSRNPGRVG